MLIMMAWVLSTPVKVCTGELTALIGIEDLRPAKPSQRFFQSIDAEVGVQCV
jgi:hypothetical protein